MKSSLSDINKVPEPAFWHCQTCKKNIEAGQVVRELWGSATAIMCPTCGQRLGEIRYDAKAPTGQS